jgi:hypothetical protein
MTITLTPTTRLVDVVTAQGTVQARIWEGETASGIAVVAMITRIAVAKTDDLTEFGRELQEQRPPSPAAEAFPARMVL